MSERNKKRLLLGGLLAALLMLSGCMAQIEERPMQDLTDVTFAGDVKAPQEDAYASGEALVTLYFLEESGEALRPVVRRIEMTAGMSRAEMAVRALMEGPLEGEAHAWWPELGGLGAARAVEISGASATRTRPW